MADEPKAAPSAIRPGLGRRSWAYGLRLLLRQLGAHQITDVAATMTYYLMLSLFPLLLALISLLNLLGTADRVVPALENALADALPGEVTQFITPIIRGFLTSQGATLVLVIGTVTALWSASNYVGAFVRAMNRVYGVREGRPMVVIRALQLGLTLILIMVLGLLGSAIALSGTVTVWLGEHVLIGHQLIVVWSALRVPVIVGLVATLLALLYYFAPNVRRPRRRFFSPGALTALALSGVIVWGFGVYLDVFNGASSYTRTYGALAGVIIALFMLWLINVTILVGAEIDAALERVVELRSGLDATTQLLLPSRDGRQIRKSQEGADGLVARAAELRQAALAAGAEPSRWYTDHAGQPGVPIGSDWLPTPTPWQRIKEGLKRPRTRPDAAAPR